MKRTGLLVLSLLIISLLTSFSVGFSFEVPMIRNQQQSKAVVYPGESVTLSAQGKDSAGLSWGWLSTNETGTWQEFKGWWDFNWKYSKTIRIDHTKVDADLINFPVLVQITSSDFAAHAQPDGDDFVFVDATNTTRFKHEIEFCPSATSIGTLVAWVNIPLVSSTHDTVFYLYYGNPNCGNQQNIGGTWNTGYLMVHHLRGLKYFNLKDSTTDHWDVTSDGGAPAYSHQGKIGECVDFNPRDGGDYLKIAGFQLPSNSSYTGSAWVYIDVDGSVSSKRSFFDGSSACGFSLLVWNDGRCKAVERYSNGSSASCYGDTAVQTGTWYYVCIRADVSLHRLDLFVNGVNENHTMIDPSIMEEMQGLTIGTNMSTDGSYMNGKIDELRLSNVARSDAWISTEYTMISSPLTFFSVGPENLPREGAWYGSPMKIQPTIQWQWANFTWQNPTLPQGTHVGWQIIFENTNGKTNHTDNMTFLIYGNAPVQPSSPAGPTSSMVGETYEFTTVTTDPDGDPIAFLFDWGDGNQSGWTEYFPSGTELAASHTWQREGTYEVRVKAKDSSGAESLWSAAALVQVILIPILPSFTVTVPSFVIEGTSFQVMVTSISGPLQDAVVSFEETVVTTNATGVVTLTAPMVDVTILVPLVVQHEGYHSATVMISVLNAEEPAAEKGWIYGWVAAPSGIVLQNAKVCVYLSGDTTMVHCTFTDAHGRYDFRVPVGTHRLEVSKYGYDMSSQSEITVAKNTAAEVNIFLHENTTPIPSPPSDTNLDIIDAVIDAGIASEKITGTLAVTPQTQKYAFTLYNDALSATVVSINRSEVFFTVAATNLSGTLFLVRLSDQQAIEDIVVTVDNALPHQVGFSEIFTMEGPHTLYARAIVTSNEQTITYCLIYLPHFSEHTISIATITKGVEVFSGLFAILTFVGIAVLALVFLVIPIVIIERKKE